jgi:hypothetical protein
MAEYEIQIGAKNSWERQPQFRQDKQATSRATQPPILPKSPSCYRPATVSAFLTNNQTLLILSNVVVSSMSKYVSNSAIPKSSTINSPLVRFGQHFLNYKWVPNA